MSKPFVFEASQNVLLDFPLIIKQLFNTYLKVIQYERPFKKLKFLLLSFKDYQYYKLFSFIAEFCAIVVLIEYPIFDIRSSVGKKPKTGPAAKIVPDIIGQVSVFFPLARPLIGPAKFF